MKKRILSLLLAAAMTVSSLSMPIFASEEEGIQELAPEENTEEEQEEQTEEQTEEQNQIAENAENTESTDVVWFDAETSADGFDAEEQDLEEFTSEETVNPEDYEFTWFDEEHADMLQADTEEEQQLLEEIQSGNVIAVAPIQSSGLGSTAALYSASADEGISLAAETSAFTLQVGTYMNMDEVWTKGGIESNHTGTAYRIITYTDDEGVSRSSPLYCMNPTKNGPLTSSVVKEEAIKILSNSNLKKILYYGYGGPGDISDSYDPTCSHCDWSKNTNRYVLTHYALSKVYSNDVSGATAAECEHVGLNRWISKLTSYALPYVKDLKFYGKNADGDVVSAANMVGNLTYYRKVPSSLAWCKMTDGVQISEVYRLTASDGKNGFKVTCAADDEWVMGYWTSADDYTTRGKSNPRILAKGKSVTLYTGARLRFAFPRTRKKNVKLSFTSRLKPIQYIAINCNIQMNGSNYQDLGTYYYEGARETLSLTFQPSPTGTVILKKIADQDETLKIEGAGYQLAAAANIISNGITVFKKDEIIEEGYTDVNGEIKFLYIPVGKYYLVETGAKKDTEAEKYLLDVASHHVTVTQNVTKTVTVKEIPDLYGEVSIRKIIAGTELNLEGAVFTLYTWSKSSNTYTNGVDLTYDADSKRYKSEVIRYTADNQGKFMVKETKNPNGFTGTFRKEFILRKFGQKELFEYTAENTPGPKRVEITKVDSVTKTVLEDAEFTIFPWNDVKGAYEEIGSLLNYNSDDGRYYSETLNITDLNKGRYKIVETKIPEGHTGQFIKEINVSEENPTLQFIAENDPDVEIKRSFQIKKTDSETGEMLSGAEFTVYQYNTATGKYENTLGENAKVPYDEKSGLYRSKDLVINSRNTGKFKVVETKAPDGYIGAWEKELVLTEEKAEPELFEAVNDRDRPPVGEIIVVKKVKESDILWAHGNPVFTFVIEGLDAKGNSRKYENYVCFTPGAYTVDENGYASLQVTFKNVPAGQYQVYEKSVLYYYLEDAIADTSNVTITKGASPAYGVQPRNIAYGTILLTAVNNRASITFVNKKARYDSYVHNDVIKNTIPAVYGAGTEN